MAGLAQSAIFAFALSAPLLAGVRPPAVLLPPIPGPVSSSSWTIGDFDGDGRLDLLTAFSSPAGPSGSHVIEFRSGAFPGVEASFRISSPTAALSLAAWDIDGDDDLDLVVTSALFHRPIGVWINDGRGGFTQGSLASLPPESPASFDRSVFATALPHGTLLFPPRDKQTRAGLPAHCLSIPLPAASPRELSIRPVYASRIADFPWSPRAPPRPLLSV